MRKNVFLILLFVLFLFCVWEDKPVWCDAVLILTIKNNQNITTVVYHEPNPEHNKWSDSLSIKQKTNDNNVTINWRFNKLSPSSQINDTIRYHYFQQDGPCARTGGKAELLSIYLKFNGKKEMIYPWSTSIYFEKICDGCENINYDTIFLK